MYADDIGLSDAGVPVNNVTPPPPLVDADDQQHLQMIADIMDNLITLVNSDYEVFTQLSQEVH